MQSNFYVSAAFGLALYSTATIFYRFTVCLESIDRADRSLTSGEYFQSLHSAVAVPHRVDQAFTIHSWVTIRLVTVRD